jgi:hypothetical protein
MKNVENKRISNFNEDVKSLLIFKTNMSEENSDCPSDLVTQSEIYEK